MTNNVHALSEYPAKVPAQPAHDDLFDALVGLEDPTDLINGAMLAAEQYGCKFLFEFPAILLSRRSGRGAAIVCPDDQGYRIVFLVPGESVNEIGIVEGVDAPATLLNFALSYANILAILPGSHSESMQ